MLPVRDVFVVAVGDGRRSVLPVVLVPGEKLTSGELPLETDGTWKFCRPGKTEVIGTLLGIECTCRDVGCGRCRLGRSNDMLGDGAEVAVVADAPAVAPPPKSASAALSLTTSTGDVNESTLPAAAAACFEWMLSSGEQPTLLFCCATSG